MTNCPDLRTEVLPEYIPSNLGAPFKVVLIDSVRQLINIKTGVVEKTIIPNPRGLLQQVALARLVSPRKLGGKDIKFVRKSLAIRANDLAEMIGISPEHLSRCEGGERVLSPGVEKCLRMAVLLEVFKLPDIASMSTTECEGLQDALNKYKQTIARLRTIIKGMSIPAAHNAEEELSFNFCVVKREDGDLFTDHPEDDDWTDEQALAA